MMKSYFTLTCCLLIVFFGCSKEGLVETGGNGQGFLIDAGQLVGKYEVIDGSVSSLGLSKGKMLAILDGKVEIHCDKQIDYTREYNTLSISGRNYLLSEKEKGQEYQISLVTASGREVCTVVRTDKDCEGEASGGEEEENEEEQTAGPVVGKVELDKLYGYGVGTTGGEGATAANTHHFDDGDKLNAWLAAREKAKSKVPAIVWLSGTFTKENGRSSGSPWFDVKDTDNITFYGTNGFRMQNVGFFIVRSNNIIIRNVYILMPKADNGADGISMQKSSNIWIDHCTFESVNQTSDYEDGALDITHATTNVTVSWNHFVKTQKSSLVGHSNSNTEDEAIRATYHHNYFDQTNSRHPRVRFGKVHVFNNFFNGASTYGVGSAYGARVLVEANYFDGVHLPTDICTYPAKRSGSSWVSNLTGSVAGYLYASDNRYFSIPSNASDPYPFINVEYKAYNGEKLATALTREDFLPEYSYEVDSPDEVKDIVMSGAGVGKLSGYDTAPLAVDNGGMPDGNTGGGGNENEPVVLENGWAALAVGSSQLQVTVGADKSSVTIQGAGKFESGKQEFSYVYREVTGDFVMTVRLDEYQTGGTSNQSLAGIFVTPDPMATDTELLHVMAAKGGTGNYHHSRRLTSGNASRGSLSTLSGSAVPVLKMERNGDRISSSVSLDGGATFGAVDNRDIVGMANKVYVGLAVSSGSSTPATASFSDIRINGAVVGF